MTAVEYNKLCYKVFKKCFNSRIRCQVLFDMCNGIQGGRLAGLLVGVNTNDYYLLKDNYQQEFDGLLDKYYSLCNYALVSNDDNGLKELNRLISKGYELNELDAMWNVKGA